jgi:hypothetical protein
MWNRVNGSSSQFANTAPISALKLLAIKVFETAKLTGDDNTLAHRNKAPVVMRSTIHCCR